MATPDTTWCLVDRNGTHYKLPWSSIFLGRDDCDITLKSRSVDPRHAVITHDRFDKQFKVKDLNSLNGTFVNETRIPEDEFVPLDHMDTLRFGYDPMVYRLERIEEITPTESQPDIRTVVTGGSGRPTKHEHSKLHDCPGCFVEKGVKHTCDNPRSSGGEPPHRSSSPLSEYSYRNRHIKDLPCPPPDRYRYPDPEYIKYPPDYHPDYPMAYYPPVYHPQPVHDIRRQDYQEYYRHVHRADVRGMPYRDAEPMPPPPYRDLEQFDPEYQQRLEAYQRYQLHEKMNRYSPDGKTREGQDPPPDIVPLRQDRRRSDANTSSPTSSTITSSNEPPTASSSSNSGRKMAVETETMETVKKGTPLYGQPSWWGEEESPDGSAEQKLAMGKIEERQSSQDLNDATPTPTPTPTTTTTTTATAVAPTHARRMSAGSEPCRTREPSIDMTPSEANNGSSRPVEPSTAFTVDFTDERPKKKISMSAGLSRFVPSKLKKGLKERKASKESGKSDNQEDQDISPESVSKDDSADGSSVLTTVDVVSAPAELAGFATPVRAAELASAGRKRDLGSDAEELSIGEKSPRDKRKKITGKVSGTPKTPAAATAKVTSRPLRPGRVELPPLKRVDNKTSSSKPELVGTNDSSTLVGVAVSDENDGISGLEAKPKPVEDNADPKSGLEKTDIGKEEADKLSETGTYTIDSGSAAEVVAEARKNIDTVFGVASAEAELLKNGSVELKNGSAEELAGSEGDETDASEQFEDDDVPVVDVRNGETPPLDSSSDFDLCGEPPNWVKRWSASESGSRPTQMVMPTSVNTDTFTRRKPTLPRSKLPSLGYHGHLAATSQDSHSEPSTPVRDWTVDQWTSNHAFVPYREKLIKDTTNLNSPRSEASLCTEVLLENTSHVVSALETMVSERQKKDSRRSTGSTRQKKVTEMSSKEKVLVHLQPGKGYNQKRASLPSVPTQQDEDVSECDSLRSRGSEVSECSERFSRSGSKTKSLTTRTNRTFALRRAKADENSSAAQQKAARTTSPGMRSDSQTSLTSKPARFSHQSNVRKGYQNGGPPRAGVKSKSSAQDLSRTDGGRFSMRARETRSSSVGGSTDVKKTSLQASRSQTSLTGSSSKHLNRDAQKELEKTAWMRRKAYDARKSVASAKQRTKPDEPKSSCSTPDSKLPTFQRRGMRRGTYTSSAEDVSNYALGVEPSESDYEDLSIRSDTVACASRELAKDLQSLACDSVNNSDLHTAELIDSMFRNHTRRENHTQPGTEARPGIECASAFSTPSVGSGPRAAGVTSRPACHVNGRLSDPSLGDGFSENNKSYDSLMVSSICRLSTKIKTSTAHLIRKLREFEQLSKSPSPVDFGQSAIPAWREANQDLATILSNLRSVEHHVKIIDGAMFPDGPARSPTTIDITSKDSACYRKRVEKAGFKPIEPASFNSSSQANESFADDDEYY